VPGEPGSEAAGPYGKHRDRGLPQFLPNKLLEVMASATDETDAGRLKRRIFKLGMLSIGLVLGGTVLAVIGLAVFSRGRFSQPAAGSGPSTIAPAKMPDAADWAARSARAREVVQGFFAGSDPERKRELILDGEFEAAALRRHHEVTGGKETGRPLLDQARAVQSGERMIYLVPVEAEGGGIRVAAVLETAQGFFLDWRSAVTPEEMTWSDFVSRKPSEPRLFRVNVAAAAEPATADAGGAEWKAYRLQRAGTEVIGAVRAGSRVADDIERRQVAAAGKPFSADLHLCFDPALPAAGMIRIAGVNPEKWNL
jgi:hypothetical protein